jgi:hypothetical protein
VVLEKEKEARLNQLWALLGPQLAPESKGLDAAMAGRMAIRPQKVGEFWQPSLYVRAQPESFASYHTTPFVRQRQGLETPTFM